LQKIFWLSKYIAALYEVVSTTSGNLAIVTLLRHCPLKVRHFHNTHTTYQHLQLEPNLIIFLWTGRNSVVICLQSFLVLYLTKQLCNTTQHLTGLLMEYAYSRTSSIQTPLCQLDHKSVQISEFVWINEAHWFLYRAMLNYSNTTYICDRIL